MKRIALFVLLTACGNGGPIGEEPLRLSANVSEVALGQAFALTVVRVWTRGSPAPEWDTDALDLKLLETEVREEGDRVQETRRYDAYAFSLRDVSLPGLELKVRPSLDPASPGAPELPAPPAARWGWAVVGAIVVLLVVAALRRKKPEVAAPVVASEPVEPSSAIALRRIAALREDPVDAEHFAREAAGLVREYLGGRDDWSTEEFLAAHPSDLLAHVLLTCDRVKFARLEPSANQRNRVLESAEELVAQGTDACS